MVRAAIIIAGVSFLVFYLTRGRAASAAVPEFSDPPAAVIRREDNGPRLVLSPNDVLPIINLYNDWGVDPRDVLATIAIESSFRPDAYRYEARLGDASYGLMQVLYRTARDMDRSISDPAMLYDPETNIRIGMRYMRWVRDDLRRRLRREPTRAEWLSGYNGGTANVARGWIGLEYVAKHDAARAAFS